MKQKGFAPLLIIILIALGVGGYLLFQKQFKPTAVSQPSPSLITSDETTNWKTYTNNNYRFTFNYPANLQIKENNFNTYKSIVFSSAYKPPFSDYFDFGIIVHQVDKKTDLRTWLDSYVVQDLPSGGKGSIVSGSIKPYRNGSLEGFYFVGGKESEYKYVFFQKENDIYEVSLGGSGTGGSYQDNPNGEKLLDQILSTFNFLDQTVDISAWKTFITSGINAGLILKYPSNWVTVNNTFISEKSFTPGEQDKTKVYNIVDVYKYTTSIYSGYSNSEWFKKIDSLKEPLNDQKEKRTKLLSGKILSGEDYVIFKDESSSTAIADTFNQVKAYILKDQTIYQLTLDLYNINGLEIFKKIVSNAQIN